MFLGSCVITGENGYRHDNKRLWANGLWTVIGHLDNDLNILLVQNAG